MSSSDSVDQQASAADIYSKPLEYRKLASLWSAIWHFIQLSGYGTVAIVVGIQIAQTYALYYTQSLRISLMTDSNPATMVQSLKYYLLINAFVSFTHRQIRNLELATFIRVIKTSPGLLVMCGPLASLNYAIERWHRGTLPKLYDVRCEAIGRPRERLDDVLKCNRPLLRIHDMTDIYLDKLYQFKSMDISHELSSDAVRRSHYLILTLFTEIIETTILIDDRFIDQLSRYISYTKDTPREQPRVVADSRPLPCWPETGEIEFRQFRLHYRSDLDPVLNELSFVVHNKEKIGIVGRTGAGKSSLTYALMRLVEADSGSIIIDGVDISTIGLHDLRSRISIIPQDPSLFEGTIRDNLDPTHQYTDDEVWAAINACQIADLLDEPTIVYKSKTKNSEKNDPTTKEESKQLSNIRKRHWMLGTGLEKWVQYKGSNFSVGQQQLVSLCRALLWRRKILVLDEATANVDTKTDQIMQSVIRQEFKNCTVLTIAHRINTIMDSDRVLVMDQGRVAEFDTPSNLLTRDSHFKRLVECMNFSKKQGQSAK
ncbi:hypothetical protein H4S03_003747 [Coemansia sp. S3946]|nr:hypothetical protein H4S03_003747 [Coemansia sp. S3946]